MRERNNKSSFKVKYISQENNLCDLFHRKVFIWSFQNDIQSLDFVLYHKTSNNMKSNDSVFRLVWFVIINPNALKFSISLSGCDHKGNVLDVEKKMKWKPKVFELTYFCSLIYILNNFERWCIKAGKFE